MVECLGHKCLPDALLAGGGCCNDAPYRYVVRVGYLYGQDACVCYEGALWVVPDEVVCMVVAVVGILVVALLFNAEYLKA